MNGELQPTLWRTCRVLAGRRRLALLGWVHAKRSAGVTELARLTGLPVAVASQELRRLQSRGLLQARRSGRDVGYRFEADLSVQDAVRLVPALRDGFRRDAKGFPARCFRLATGFTHVRRIDIVRSLAAGACAFDGLSRRTGIQKSALARHLAKLVRRGLVDRTRGLYRLPVKPMGLARHLLDLALHRAPAEKGSHTLQRVGVGDRPE
jgi:DNA-binding transcriptional ArsR family regulator